MRRIVVWTMLLAATTLAAGATPAAAQVEASLHLFFSWSDGGWREGRVVDGHVTWSNRDHVDGRRERWRHDRDHHGRKGRGARPARRARPAHVAPVRIPPGHLPPPGMCRVWVVGVPPGRQAPPVPCGGVWRLRPGPDVIVVQTPVRR